MLKYVSLQVRSLKIVFATINHDRPQDTSLKSRNPPTHVGGFEF